MRPIHHLLSALLTAVIAAQAPSAGAQEAPPRQIVVTGQGEVETPPDLATISAGVETEAPTAEAALAANSAAMTAVLDALAAATVAPADVQTSALGLEPVWQNPQEANPESPEIAGFLARNIVTIRLRDVAALGGVVDALARAGANRLYGIGFSHAEAGPIEDRALEQAVADARAKAELLARAAGVTLGPVLSLSEAGADGPFPLARAEMAMDVPVAPGSVEVSAQVEMVFGIE